MARVRTDVFQMALVQVRERVRDGVFPPGMRITAVELADDLRLSATPVREALSRLAGEGVLVDRRGQGFFVRQLTAPDIADLYRLSLAGVMIAFEPRRGRRTDAAPAPGAMDDDPVRAVDTLLVTWVAGGGSLSLVANLLRVQGQLSRVRRLEAHVFPDLAAEAAALVALTPDPEAERAAAARRWHVRRIRASHQLAALLDPEQRNTAL